MAKLYFRYGAMGSSKSANAIMVQYNYYERGQNALMLKPCLDHRDGARIVGSRSGLSAPCSYVEEIDDIDLSSYNCVIVDEAQFLTKEQVEKLADIADDKNIPVICYGLRADFQGNLFEGSTWLMAWADTIEEIKTVCWCGRKATYNARVINGKVARQGEQIVLGGNESYVALCRKHWKSGELAPKEIRMLTTDTAPILEKLSDADPVCLDGAEMYVLMFHGQAVAEAVITADSDDICVLRDISVASDQRSQKLGSELIQHLIRIYRSRSSLMKAAVPSESIGFFEKFGFVPVGTAENGTVLLQKQL